MIEFITLLLVGGLSLLSASFVYVIRIWARRREIYDIPNARSSHILPTPRGGGLVIVAMTIFAGIWSLFFIQFQLVLVAYLIGGALIAVVSWLDDLRSVPNRTRFACHLVGAFFIVVSLVIAAPGELAGDSRLWWFFGPIVVTWIVGFTNIYNFMDGIDGLAACQAAIAALWWLLVATQRSEPLVGMIALTLAAASIGFLLHNWAPAKIFMGDVGSAFLGYSFAVLPLIGFYMIGQLQVLIGGVLVVWPFIFDGTLTIIRRALNGENIFQAHRSHLYQRMTIHGWAHRSVSLLYGGYMLISASCAFALVMDKNSWPLVALPLGFGVGLFALVRRIEHPSMTMNGS